MSDDGNGSERWLRALNAALATAWPFGNLAWLFGRRPRATTQDNS